jgi:hypothetical protein
MTLYDLERRGKEREKREKAAKMKPSITLDITYDELETILGLCNEWYDYSESMIYSYEGDNELIGEIKHCEEFTDEVAALHEKLKALNKAIIES